MNHPLLRGVLAASLALNLGFVAAVAWHLHAPAPTTSTTAPAHVPLDQQLQLSASQRQRWQSIEPAFLQDIDRNWRAIHQHREALVRAIFSASPDHQAIQAQQAQIAALQEAQQQRVIAQLLAEHDILEPAQRAKLMALLLERYTQEATEEELLHRD